MWLLGWRALRRHASESRVSCGARAGKPGTGREEKAGRPGSSQSRRAEQAADLPEAKAHQRRHCAGARTAGLHRKSAAPQLRIGRATAVQRDLRAVELQLLEEAGQEPRPTPQLRSWVVKLAECDSIMRLPVHLLGGIGAQAGRGALPGRDLSGRVLSQPGAPVPQPMEQRWPPTRWPPGVRRSPSRRWALTCRSTEDTLRLRCELYKTGMRVASGLNSRRDWRPRAGATRQGYRGCVAEASISAAVLASL